MLPDVRIILRDIRGAIEEIESFTSGMDEATFKKQVVVRNATHWSLAVIGEAMRRLRDLDMRTAETISEWDRIIRFRNQILHGYSVIKFDVTWRVVQTKLPVLRREVDALLAEADI